MFAKCRRTSPGECLRRISRHAFVTTKFAPRLLPTTSAVRGIIRRRIIRMIGAGGVTRSNTGGQGGIRTLERLLTVTHFPGVRLKPLGHLSGDPRGSHATRGRGAKYPASSPNANPAFTALSGWRDKGLSPLSWARDPPVVGEIKVHNICDT